MAITAVIINFKREKNLPKIINSLQHGLVKEIIIFNNNPDTWIDINGVTVINSEKNWRCWAKYVIGQMVKTPWVLSMDDDLMLGEKGLDLLWAEVEENNIYGFWGVNPVGKSYVKGNRVWTKRIDKKAGVDILLGRLILCQPYKMAYACWVRTQIPDYRDKPYIYNESEDIVLTMSNQGKNYVVPSVGDEGVIDLPEHGQSLFRRGDEHRVNRNLAVEEMLKWNG